ncbi:MAG: hypothetical protein RR954_09640 [Christensenellaceae bacterium]
MYNNIGSKNKILAQVIAWIGIIGSVITGFILIAQGMNNHRGGETLVGIGVGVLIGGSFLSWVASWFMFGFGELIEKATEIAINTAKGTSSRPLTSKMENDEKMKTLISWKESNLISEEEFEIKKQALLRGE